MLELRTLELSDKPQVDKLLKISDFRGCEYCFANNLAWRRMYDTKISFFKEVYVSCSFMHGEGIRFTFPAGGGNYEEIFDEMRRFSDSNGFPLEIGSVLPSQLQIFEELFPNDSYTVSTDEGGWDYVYLSSDLAELNGKKYHGKRNHLKKLLDREYSYSPITEKDYDECIAFAALAYNQSNGYDEYSKICEQFAIHTFFENYEALGLSGGILRTDGKISAFTIGERINSDTLGVHIEKADTSVEGAYPAINYLFANDAGKDFMYINREEDMGVEGLRKAKRSYHPAFMIEKYTVKFK
ncbi:MAG: DUF2156 domain-containing protein [Huintestinicola sp.]